MMIGDNSNLFDLTYVDNAAYAHILASDKLGAGLGVEGQVYLCLMEAFIITNDQPIFFWDYPKYLLNELGYKNTQQIVLPTSFAYGLGALMDGLAAVLKPVVEIHPSLTRFLRN